MGDVRRPVEGVEAAGHEVVAAHLGRLLQFAAYRRVPLHDLPMTPRLLGVGPSCENHLGRERTIWVLARPSCRGGKNFHRQ
jgi:hypothetical protein